MRRLLLTLLLTLLTTTAQAGAFGSGSFENDDALDWVALCVRSSGAKPVAAALQAGAGGGYVEAPQGSMAVAAAEVVAAAMGKTGGKLPDQLNQWLKGQPKAEIAALAPLARRALAKVKDSKASELRQLWSEGDAREWLQQIEALEARLGK